MSNPSKSANPARRDASQTASAALGDGKHPVTGTKLGNRGGAARLALLASALLSDPVRLQEATGDPDAHSFYPNQIAAVLCDDRTQASEKSRQIGESFAFAADSLARAILEPATTNIHISTDKWESESKHNYVLRTLEVFPRQLRSQIKVRADAKNHIELETASGISSIDFLAQRPPRGAERGGIYLHEMAHMAKMKAILKAAIFCTTKGGFVKGCSSHEGSDSLFNQIITNAEDEETGERPYDFWTRGTFPWWTCPALCLDIEQAMREAPHMETDERVARFGTQTLKELRAASSLEDFQEECECLVIDSKYSYFPMELIHECQSKDENYYFEKAELTGRDVGAVGDAKAAIDRLKKEIDAGRLPGRWFWAYDIGVTSDPDALTVIQSLREDGTTVALRLAITLHDLPFQSKQEIIGYLIKTLPVEAGRIDATGPGEQMGQWGETNFRQKALAFKFTTATKSTIVNELKIRMERTDALGSRRLILPVWKKLARQIHSIRKTVMPSGGVIYDASREDNAHADIFFSLAMANALVEQPSANYAFTPPVLSRPGVLQLGGAGQQRGGLGTGRIWVPGRS